MTILLTVLSVVLLQLPDIDGLVGKGGGTTVHLTTERGVDYSLYTPGADPDSTYAGRTAIVLLHGAGDNHKNFMTAWTSYPFSPDWIAISIDAEANKAWQASEVPRVMEVLDAVESRHAIRRVFVGGFSRGGGFCYNVALTHPDRFDGILSLAGNVWNPGLIKPTHAGTIAVAIVHGDADTIIPPKHGQDAKERFEKAGYKTYLKIIEGWAHTLHGKETANALAWLDETAAPLKSAKDYYAYAMTSFKEGHYAQAAWALREIDNDENQDEPFYKKISSTLEKIETRSERKAKRLLKDIDADKNSKWLKAWREYDRAFGGTTQHGEVSEKVAALSEKHTSAAEEFYEAAVVARGLSDFEVAIEKCVAVRDECYLATGDVVKDTKALLAEFRGDAEIAKKHRKLLKGTEAW